MKAHDFCGFTKPCVDKNKSRVDIQSNDDLLNEMIGQQIGQLFEEISSTNKDLDQELANGELKSCSLSQFDSFPESCKKKLKNHKIDSAKFQEVFSTTLNGGDFSPKCMNGADSHYLLAESEEKSWMRTILSDKDAIDDLLKSKSEEEMLKLLEKKYSNMLKLNNPRLNIIFSSRSSLKSYIANNNSFSEDNKKQWAKSLEGRCSAMFKSLETFLCSKVPDGPFAISDYKYVKHFHADLNDDFNKDYCSKDKKELDLSDPFTEKAIYAMSPNHKDDLIRNNRDINKVICPLKTKCEADSNPINCLKSECTKYSSATKEQLKKNVVGQQQKKYCEDLFDFKNGGTIKNQELVNFLAEKKEQVPINGMLVPSADSKLMNYFITPAKPGDKVAEKVEKTNIKQVTGNENSPLNGKATNNVNTNYTNIGNQPVNTGSFQGNSAINTKKTVNQNNKDSSSEPIDTTDYENTINAQNQLLDRLEKAKNQQTNSNESGDSKTGNSKVKNSNVVTNSPNTGTTTTQGTSVGDSTAPIGTPSPTTTPTSEVGTNKAKTGERNVSSNGNGTSAKGDNTKVNFGSNMDGTTLEAKNNISSSMDVNKEGQYKVTLKNLDPKTLNMELFKDEVKKQAKDAIDKGIPFVISIVNNDKEITINMIPKEKNGKITYIPTPKDDSAESLAFAEKLKNSFHSESKSKTGSNVKRSKLSELENNLK